MSYSPNAKISSPILWTPTCGLTGTDGVYGKYIRHGNILKGYIKAHWSGAATGTNLTFTLPSGLTIPNGQYGNSDVPSVLLPCGYGKFWNLAAWTPYPTWVAGDTTTRLLIMNNAAPAVNVTPTVPFIIGADDWGEWTFEVQIVEWT